MEYLFIDSPEDLDWAEARSLNSCSSLCISLSELEPQLDVNRINEGFDEDIVHAGLYFYQPNAFEKILLAALNWFFLRPSTIVKSTSWMASLHVLIIRQGVLDSLLISNSYRLPHMVAADLTFQVLKNGGLVAFNPSVLIHSPKLSACITVSESDLRIFVTRFFGKRACAIAFPLSLVFDRRVSGQARLEARPGRFAIKGARRVKTINAYTAIIPTINRYQYLKKAVYSLLTNPVPPDEIVVVDQTPESLRLSGYYDEFEGTNVRVYFLDVAGQSTARNYALKHSTKDWILFFDDDSEAWEDMISEHKALLEYSVADVSTGLSLAPWKDKSYIAQSISFHQVAPVLDTGNCMIEKRLVEAIQMFDPAFDKGSGADDNLGKRLFLKGACIVFNPMAIRTHHKAPMGGLREHGAWWKNKGTYFGPFPLPTESYDFSKFYPRSYYLRLCLYRLMTSYRRSGILMNIINTLFFPVKLWASYRRSRKLLAIGLKSD